MAAVQSLSQATADAIEQVAEHQRFRAEQHRVAGDLRAQVAHLQALGATTQHELEAAVCRIEGEMASKFSQFRALD
jgi:hypothetical protein